MCVRVRVRACVYAIARVRVSVRARVRVRVCVLACVLARRCVLGVGGGGGGGGERASCVHWFRTMSTCNVQHVTRERLVPRRWKFGVSSCGP